MSQIQERAYARAGLLGNPSDGYGGKTLSVIVKEFFAEVRMEPSTKLTLVPDATDVRPYDTVFDLVSDIRRHGYYGGLRLLKAAIKRFVDYIGEREALHHHGFTISYQSTIPRNVGLGGSSAIIVATLKALARFYKVPWDPDILASLALSVETDELGIPAGLQDRVVQAYEALVFMDFGPAVLTRRDAFSVGRYEPLDARQLPPLYLAYADEFGEPTESLHGDLRKRFQNGEPEVVQAMKQFADLAEQGRAAVLAGDAGRLGELIDANFDLRQKICELHPAHVQLVQAARSAGASAKYTGSGGAIVGTFKSEADYGQLVAALDKINCHVIRPSW